MMATHLVLLLASSTVFAEPADECSRYMNNPNAHPVADQVTIIGKVRLNRMIERDRSESTPGSIVDIDPSIKNIRYVVEFNPGTLFRNSVFRACGVRAVTILNRAGVFTDALLGRTVSITGVLGSAEVSVEEIDNATMEPTAVQLLY